jgi:hypothetical protein
MLVCQYSTHGFVSSGKPQTPSEAEVDGRGGGTIAMTSEFLKNGGERPPSGLMGQGILHPLTLSHIRRPPSRPSGEAACMALTAN